MNLVVNVAEVTNKTSVILEGEIDAYTAPKLKEALIPLTKKQESMIEVDLEKVNYMDSTGLGIFIGALKSTKEHGSSLKLVHLQDRVYRLFQITGLIEIMDINALIRGGQK